MSSPAALRADSVLGAGGRVGASLAEAVCWADLAVLKVDANVCRNAAAHRLALLAVRIERARDWLRAHLLGPCTRAEGARRALLAASIVFPIQTRHAQALRLGARARGRHGVLDALLEHVGAGAEVASRALNAVPPLEVVPRPALFVVGGGVEDVEVGALAEGELAALEPVAVPREDACGGRAELVLKDVGVLAALLRHGGRPCRRALPPIREGPKQEQHPRSEPPRDDEEPARLVAPVPGGDDHLERVQDRLVVVSHGPLLPRSWCS
eukprot:CAMPEP_0206238668 /NCGR_PEP_ID=MMETSP0047_2-20121206/14944_1 /ASSEMBLY_ACC=CAM_ASM_000192 /TAXON_ID=195065 /ORGANISM="Chroomonas mesostigmatica_cf, Strain CCMP1168" /LENGTH=267 /DNA_ID=CAMNT_0053663231 /DNA_START=739 /DNA_END=1540 /DNA_ORIENTATION=+